MQLSPYYIQFPRPEASGHTVVFCTRTASAVIVSSEMLRSIKQNDLSNEERADLSDLGILVKDAETEKTDMAGYIDEMNRLGTVVKPTVVMNLDCNLACPYCFEGTRKGKYFLSENTIDELTGFLAGRLDGKNEINPTFYGGEPLLSIDMIEAVSRRLRALADSRGLYYGFSMVTNGTLLTRKAAQRLKELGLGSVQVTLDGPRDVHDPSRPFKSGARSFDTIVRNLQETCDLVDVNISGNYTHQNFREFPRLLDHLCVSGLGPDRIASVEFSPVFRESNEFVPDFYGGCTASAEPWAVEAGIFLRRQVIEQGYGTAAMEPTVCMVERDDRFVVNWNGDLYKCPNFIGRKEYCIGTLAAGMRDYRSSHAIGQWKNGECLSCAYLPLCFGGCRFFRLLNTGTMHGVDCKKAYFDAVLPELVMQDLRAK